MRNILGPPSKFKHVVALDLIVFGVLFVFH